jgi:hypothetical protein
MYRFAKVVYEQMNYDNIPITVLFDKIPDSIIELAEAVEILDLDKSRSTSSEDASYYIIIGSNEDRRAVYIGGRWGSVPWVGNGANELTRAINEYLENTERRVP